MTNTLTDTPAATVEWDDYFQRIELTDSDRIPTSKTEARKMLKAIDKGGLDALSELDLADGVAELAFGFLRAMQDRWTDIGEAAARFAAVAERAVGNDYPGTAWSIGMKTVARENDTDDVELWWERVESETRWASPPR